MVSRKKKDPKKKEEMFFFLIIILAVRSVLMSTPKSIRESIITQAANILACYRKNCAQTIPAGQLILPDTLKLLPVYVCSLIKSDALTGSMLEILFLFV